MSVKQPRTRKFMAHEPGFTIIDAMNRLFPTCFGGESWDGSRAILRAAFCHLCNAIAADSLSYIGKLEAEGVIHRLLALGNGL
jgi:hypothetical protein